MDLFGSLDYAVVFNEYNIDKVAASNPGTLLGRSASCSSVRWASPPNSRSTFGCLTPWKDHARFCTHPRRNDGERWLYLVARMFPFFGAESMHGELADLAFIIATIGGTTAVMAAAIAFVQHDLKKVLAYSTMSQLAYIFTGLGAALYLPTPWTGTTTTKPTPS